MDTILLSEKQLRLPPGRLVGFVVDPSGTPVNGVDVSMSPGTQPPGDAVKRRVTMSSATGRFSFDSIRRADYIILAQGVGMEAQWRQYRGVNGITDTLCVEMRKHPTLLDPVGIGIRKDTLK